jgi:DUF2905 family protein
VLHHVACDVDRALLESQLGCPPFIIMARLLILLGLIFVALGIAWPWLIKLGLGRLPGDIRIEREGFSFFFPLTTGLIISAVVSVVLWLLRK